MEDSIDELERICDLLIELAALQHLNVVWAPNTTEDRHLVDRFMLLQTVTEKKKAQIAELQRQYPELKPVLESLSQQYTQSH